MATFTAIKNKSQSSSAMKNSLDYIKQKGKPLWQGCPLVTGYNCVAQSAYHEMITTKQHYHKTGGRMFYHFVQSFSPEENVAPEEVHAIGLELAQRLFPDFEVVVATHVDTDHLHNHLIVNSVSYADGHKLHQNAADFQHQRQISDEICATHGLTVLEPPKKYTHEKQMRPGEYRSAAKGQSWKFQLINTIDLCMRRSKTKAEFLREMEQRGYQVRWEPNRKAITYTTPAGMRCRDDRLHDDKYKKEVMEREFRIRGEIIRRRVEAEEFTHRTDTTPGGLSHGGTVDGVDENTGRPVSGHSPAAQSHAGSEQAVGKHALDTVCPDKAGRSAGERIVRDPLEDRTGWEQERTKAFTTAQDTSAHAVSGMALDHPYLDSIGHSLVRLGHALERDQSPASTAPIIGHGDHKTLAKERAKKIAMGHRPDDHEQQIMY